MFRQAKEAVQTLTGRGPAVADPEVEDMYLLDESHDAEPTEPDQDGQSNEHADLTDLQATVERLVQGQSEYSTRMSDKDQYIGRLERENQNYREGTYAQPTDRQPAVEPEPVLDTATASLFAEKYKEAPEAALVALAEHLDTRSQGRLEESQRQRDDVQQATATLQAIEQNILRQVDLAVRNFGPAGSDIVDDFMNIVRRGNGTAQDFAQTWLGNQLASDRGMASSAQGVYHLIELEAYRRQGTAQAQQQEEQPVAPVTSSANVMRPTAPVRSVTDLSDSTDEIPVEDRIGNAIVNAARRDDDGLQVFLG